MNYIAVFMRDPLYAFNNADWAIRIMITLTIPIFMLGHQLPHRASTRGRAIASIAVLFIVVLTPVVLRMVTSLNELQSFIVFSALLLVYVLILMFVYDTDLWPALFCATAGYTLQNLASGLEVLISLLVSGTVSESMCEPLTEGIAYGIPLIVYVAGYMLFARNLDSESLASMQNRSMLIMFAVTVFMIIGFDIVIKGLAWYSASFTHLVLLRLIFPMICMFVLFAEYEILYAHRLSAEKSETERILAERDRQYRLSRENIEAINIKCHDIRHQIRHLADGSETVNKDTLADIAREVNVYDSVIETGNEALDTILTEKSLACANEGIVLSCIADGAALGYMSPSDIYSLFGNALDNAIEAVRKVEDKEHRTITLNVVRRGNMVAINIENYYYTEPLFVNGIPQSTKGDRYNHGFGTKSMSCIVERNNGTLHVGAKDGVFYLNALLPAQA